MKRHLVSTDAGKFKLTNDLKIRIKKKWFSSVQWIVSEVNWTVQEQVFTNMLC